MRARTALFLKEIVTLAEALRSDLTHCEIAGKDELQAEEEIISASLKLQRATVAIWGDNENKKMLRIREGL